MANKNNSQTIERDKNNQQFNTFLDGSQDKIVKLQGQSKLIFILIAPENLSNLVLTALKGRSHNKELSLLSVIKAFVVGLVFGRTSNEVKGTNYYNKV